MSRPIPFLEDLKQELLEHAKPSSLPHRQPRSPARLSGAWVAAAAFVVTLLVGGLTWILSGGDSPPVAAGAEMLLDSFTSGDVIYEFRTYPNTQGADAPCVGLEFDLETGGHRATMACPTTESEETEYAGQLEDAPPWSFVVGFGLEPGERIKVDDAIRVITTEPIDQRRFFLLQFGQPVDESFQIPVTRPDGTTRFITVLPPDPSPVSTTTTLDPASLSDNTFDLLDGSELEFVGPSDLDLTGYRFTIDVPEIGSSTVDLAQGVDPADPEAVDEAAVFESNLGDGIRLWRADRGGQPFYLSVDLGGWGAFLHVGNETAPDTDLLLSLADQVSGAASDNGVVLDEYSPDFFTTYLNDPATENQIHLGANQCVRELIPDADVVEDPAHGEVIRGDGYVSWCDEEADIEVTVYGDEQFVEQVIRDMTLNRSQPQDPQAARPERKVLQYRLVSDMSVSARGSVDLR